MKASLEDRIARLEAEMERARLYRQHLFIHEAVASFISQELGIELHDDGNLDGLVEKLRAAIRRAAA